MSSKALESHFPGEPDLAKALAAEEHNGFGFQAYGAGPPGHLVFAKVAEENEGKLGAAMRRDTASETVREEEFLGRVFLSVHYSEWALIPQLFQYAIDHGEDWVAVHTPSARLSGAFKRGERFSWDSVERKTIDEFLQLVQEGVGERYSRGQHPWAVVYKLFGEPWAWRKPWNWHSGAGKTFCTQLREALGKKRLDPAVRLTPPRFTWPGIDEACKRFGVLHRGGWSAWDVGLNEIATSPETAPSTALSSTGADAVNGTADLTQEESTAPPEDEHPSSPSKRQKLAEEEEDPNLCMICWDRPSNTLVLPCEHVVVCTECSEGLRATADARTCVRCRNPITEVLCDGAS